MPERNTLWEEELVLAHSSRGDRLLYLERHGGDSPSHQDKLRSRKQWWRWALAFIPCPLSYFIRPMLPAHLAYDMVTLIVKLGLPTQLILWKCLHRQVVCFNLLMILNPVMLGDGTMGLEYTEKLANTELYSQILDPLMRISILIVRAFISWLYT